MIDVIQTEGLLNVLQARSEFFNILENIEATTPSIVSDGMKFASDVGCEKDAIKYIALQNLIKDAHIAKAYYKNTITTTAEIYYFILMLTNLSKKTNILKDYNITLEETGSVILFTIPRKHMSTFLFHKSDQENFSRFVKRCNETVIFLPLGLDKDGIVKKYTAINPMMIMKNVKGQKGAAPIIPTYSVLINDIIFDGMARALDYKTKNEFFTKIPLDLLLGINNLNINLKRSTKNSILRTIVTIASKHTHINDDNPKTKLVFENKYLPMFLNEEYYTRRDKFIEVNTSMYNQICKQNEAILSEFVKLKLSSLNKPRLLKHIYFNTPKGGYFTIQLNNPHINNTKNNHRKRSRNYIIEI